MELFYTLCSYALCAIRGLGKFSNNCVKLKLEILQTLSMISVFKLMEEKIIILQQYLFKIRSKSKARCETSPNENEYISSSKRM